MPLTRRKENPVRFEAGVAVISLTQGRETRIDRSDWPKIRGFVWFAHRRMGKYYAATNSKKRGPGRKMISLHRFLLPGHPTVDHRDGDSLNNVKNNLRPATQAQQIFNRSKSRGFTSRYKGVSWHVQHQKWYASISFQGRRKFLGLFLDEVEAAQAYDVAAKKYFGEFARVNL